MCEICILLEFNTVIIMFTQCIKLPTEIRDSYFKYVYFYSYTKKIVVELFDTPLLFFGFY